MYNSLEGTSDVKEWHDLINILDTNLLLCAHSKCIAQNQEEHDEFQHKSCIIVILWTELHATE